MKPTYKLIGAHWDGLDQVDPLPRMQPYRDDVLSLAYPPDLLDGERVRRCTSVTTVLSFESLEKVDEYFLRGVDCDELFLVVDYCPRSSGTVPRAFYERRLRQVVARAASALPQADIFLMRGYHSKAEGADERGLTRCRTL